MISCAEVPGLEVSPFLLLFIGFAVGVVAGFIGVGGGFMVTPTLIVLGFPGGMAVGTGIANVTGTSVMATMRHRELGNVDMRLGLLVIVGMTAGIEIGVRIVNRLKDAGLADEAVLAASLGMLAFIGAYTAWEVRSSKRRLDEMAPSDGRQQREMVTSGMARKLQGISLPPLIHLPKSRVTVSLWVILAIGLGTGVLAGFIGVGGGFMLVPALVYLIGIPSFIAVGTSLLQMVVSGGYGTIRHTMSGNVLIFAAFLLLLGASLGTQIGTLATRYVTGPAIRLVLALAVGFAALGTAFELADVITDETIGFLDIAAKATLLGGMAVLTLSVVTLLTLGVLYQRGRRIPAWAQSLCCKN